MMIRKNLVVLFLGVFTLMMLMMWANAFVNSSKIYEDKTGVQRLSDFVDRLESVERVSSGS